MSKTLKSTLAVLLAIVFLISAMPITASAAASDMKITVSTKNAMAGQTVEIDVAVSNNPGVAAISLDIDYDKDNLTLLGFTYNDLALSGASTTPYNASASIPCLFMVNGTQNITGDFVFATLTFEVKADAQENIAAPITLSYDPDNIYDITEENIDCEIVNGAVNIISCIPGDINGDEKVNSKDVSRLMQYHAHWDVEVNEPALDTNGDGKLNSKDVTRLMQYLAHWDLVLYPLVGDEPSQGLKAVSAKAATCTEDGNIAYWYDAKENKYYRDSFGANEISLEETIIPAHGHSPVTVAGYAPTTESAGLTDGVVCSVCDEWIQEQVVIPPLSSDQYSITYYINNNDNYLKQQIIENPNPATYTSEEGLELDDLLVEGYNFKGWYTAQTGGTLITRIEPGSTGKKVLYAHWEKVPYHVTFDSPLVPVSSIERTVDQTTTLSELSCNGYVFMGWSDETGDIVKSVLPGTTDITLYANWTSLRNQTRPNDYASEGAQIIDLSETKGQYLFIYDLGTIVNVPLYTIRDFANSVGITISESYTTSGKITEQDAKSINEVVANSTTKSTAWTLANTWNNSVTESENHAGTTTDNVTYVVSDSSSTSNTSSGSGTIGGTDTVAYKDTTSSKTISKDTYGLNLDVEASAKSKLIGGGLKVGVHGSAEWENTDEQGSSFENSGSNSTNWNMTSGYSSSASASHSSSVSNSVTKSITDSFGYSVSKSTGGSDARTETNSDTSSQSKGYTSAFTYTTENTETRVSTWTNANAPAGWYRLVCAGDIHVFGIVGYDIATHSYYVYTYSVLDDNTYDFYDYSKTDSHYEDYNNGVLPFAIPYAVNDYISNALYVSDGLIVDRDTGHVTDYEGTSKNVYVPDYVSLANGDDTYAVVKVTGINEGVFTGNTNITHVRLGKYITSIPDNAFSGCASLEEVVANSPLTSIGDNAFYGCEKLESFVVTNSVEYLGEHAFSSSKNITVNAKNSGIALAAMNTGAKNLVLNLSTLEDELHDTTLCPDTTGTFTLMGAKKAYSNVRIVSDAKTTELNLITFTNNKGLPLEIGSDKLLLNQVTVEPTSGIAMNLKADETVVLLQGKSTITTSGSNAVLSKSINFNRAPGVTESSSLTINGGNVLVFGTVVNERYLVINDGEIVYLTEEEYEAYLNTHFVYYDANGGQVATASKTFVMGDKYGELPVPEREGFEFLGWYLGDTEVSSEMTITTVEDITLRARWMSGWVLENNVPANADTDGAKWSYDLTSYTTSGESSLAGWTQYDSTWVWGEWGDWSAWSKTAPNPGASDSRKVETRTVTDRAAYTSYTYWIYRTPNGNGWGTQGYSTNQGTCSVYDSIEITTWLSDTEYGCCGYYQSPNFSSRYANQWFRGDSHYHAAVTHTEYRYCDRSKVYTYYYSKVDNLEATSDPTGQENVSNVQKWVKYIEK